MGLKKKIQISQSVKNPVQKTKFKQCNKQRSEGRNNHMFREALADLVLYYSQTAHSK